MANPAPPWLPEPSHRNWCLRGDRQPKWWFAVCGPMVAVAIASMVLKGFPPSASTSRAAPRCRSRAGENGEGASQVIETFDKAIGNPEAGHRRKRQLGDRANPVRDPDNEETGEAVDRAVREVRRRAPTVSRASRSSATRRLGDVGGQITRRRSSPRGVPGARRHLHHDPP